MDHEGWVRVENLNLQRCVGITDRGLDTLTSFVDFQDMWVQSRSFRSLQASGEWGAEGLDQIAEVGDNEFDFQDDVGGERFSPPGSGENLSHELASNDDISHFSSHEWNGLGQGGHKISGIKDKDWCKSGSMQDLALPKKDNAGRSSSDDNEFDDYEMRSESQKSSLGQVSPIEAPQIVVEELSQSQSHSQSQNLSSKDGGKSCAFSLRRLNLRDCSFLTDNAIASLASVSGHLRVLNLSFCCSLTEDFARHLVKGCSKLSRLDVSFCGGAITDHTLLHLSTGLTRLRGLSVRGCIQVTDVGIDHLVENARKLEVVNVTQCKNISPELAEKLKKLWKLVETESVCDVICEWEES
jgi:hypothetical protein